jgi:hypothetical protein
VKQVGSGQRHIVPNFNTNYNNDTKTRTMKKRHIPILLLILTNCLISSAQPDKDTEVKISRDSCLVWNLPEVNFTVQIPKDYIISYHSSGGFYFQANKYQDDNLVSQVTFGQLTGSIDNNDLVDLLAVADSEVRKQFDEIKQVYKTRFIGVDNISGNMTVPNLRNYVEFKDFDPKMNGKFQGLSVPVVFSDKNKFILSSLFRTNQQFNDKNIGLEIIKILESIKEIKE